MSKETVLLVDDEPNIIELARMYLEQDGYAVIAANDGQAALDRIAADAPDLVVLDLMLPRIDGWDVCKRVRAKSDLPIIMLTARDEDAERIVGLELGADDYLAKPFSPNELVARVRALMRRAQRAEPDGPALTFGGLVMDLSSHTVSLDGHEVRLTAKEFMLLEYLMRHRGRVLSRDLLLADVWGYRYTGGTRTVDVHVRRLREKLPILVSALETVKQFGYKLVEQSSS